MNIRELHEQIDHDFTYHAPSEEQARVYELLRRQYRGVAHLIAELCPGSRELALAKTKLEESLMWANAAIARKGLRQPEESPEEVLEEARRRAE